MKLFLAGTGCRPQLFKKHRPLYVLESFFYIKPFQLELLDSWKGFLLDSGAFTFMNNAKSRVGFSEYVDKYIKFINEHDIKHFFELDIDSVVGYQEVLQIRNKIEQQTMKKCIPVWHKSRGKEEFKRMCEEYDYVALGGLAIKEIKKSEYDFLYWFTDYAHRHNCKIHGLGFTGQNAFKYGFDTVDSTGWQGSSRFGRIDIFDGKKIVKVKTPEGKKPVHYLIRDEFVFGEWIKYQKYLDNITNYEKIHLQKGK